MFGRVVAIAAACLVATASGKEHIQAAIRRGDVTSRAANLGGWLLSECWMAYSSPLYKNVPESVGYTGEYGVMKFLGQEQGNKQFEEHWKTWITEDDIAEIAKAGLNTVRVSTGYWIINDVDKTDTSDIAAMYPKGGLKYLDTLINDWAVKYNLAVMVSLHAHKGSQNGLDHSAPVEMWKVGWGKDEDSVKSSLNYAKVIAHRYRKSKAFLGLNLMNEPTTGVEYTTLHQYYKDAYKAIRKDNNDCIIVTSPLLPDQGPPIMQDFMPCPDYYNVWHEFHVYYKWGWEQAAFTDVLAKAAEYADNHYKWWQGNPIFLGEWSLATAKETETDEQLKEFADVQMKEAEKSPAGWAFWAWRHADEAKKTSGWSMRQLLRKGILTIPTDTPHALKRKETCPVVELSQNSSIDDSSSGSSGSAKNKTKDTSGSADLPGKVVAPDTSADLSTNSTKTTKTPAPSSAFKVLSASAAVAVASIVAMLL